MKIIIKSNILIILLSLLSSCIEKTGYYDSGQEAVLSRLTNNKWERTYHSKLDNGTEMDIYEVYSFSTNGSGSYQTKTTYMDGNIENNTSYFHWSFMTPNFQYIYMDYPLFWEIRELTDDKLSIYETYKDPLTEPNQHYRSFQEYTPVKNKRKPK